MEKDVKIFGDSYLDTDTDPKLNKGSDYILNTIIQSDGRFGVAVNIKGNEKVIDLSGSYSSSAAIIGSCKDESRNRIIFFVKGLVEKSSIWYYDIEANATNVILSENFFAIGDIGANITGNVVANVIGDLLLWTDGVNPPRKINYIKAYNYTNSASTTYKYLTLSDYMIEAYKRPPSFKPVLTNNISALATKVIRNKIYQFAYRYVYDDFEKSVLSPFSDVLFTDDSAFPDGSGTNASSAYSVSVYMKLFELINGVSNDIDSIEVFVRNSDFGNWYLYDKISNPKITSFSFTYFSLGFYNNGAENINDMRGTVSKSVYDSIPIGMQLTRGFNTYIVGEKLTSGSNYILGIAPVIDEVVNFIALSQVSSQWRAMTARGNNIYACISGNDICMQTNGTGSFVGLGQTFRNWVGMTTTPGGNVYASVQSGGDIYKQTAGTGNFVALSQTLRNWRGMASTPSGNVYACVAAGDIYKQTSGTGNFIALGQTSRSWEGMTCDPSGNVYACVFGGDIYKQTSGSGNFIALGQTTRNWEGMACDSFGNVYACVEGGDIYIQFAGTVNFLAQGQANRLWQGMAVAANGNVYAAVYFGDIYKRSVPAGAYTFTLAEYLQYLFKDDKVKQNVDQDDLARPYDFLPKLAGTQELIEKDRIIYGDITEGFDDIDVNIDTSVITTTTSLDNQTVVGIFAFISSALYGTYRFQSYPSNILYTLKVYYNFSGTNYRFLCPTYLSHDGDTETTILTALMNSLKGLGVVNIDIPATTPKYIRIRTDNVAPQYPGLDHAIQASCYGYGNNVFYKSLKNNDSYLGSIRYYDKDLRFTGENKFKSAIITPSIYSNFNDVYSLRCDIKNLPPIDAYYYSLDFTKRIKSNYFIRLLTVATVNMAYFDATDGYLRIAINKLINDSIDLNPSLKIKSYSFEAGDRILFIGAYFNGAQFKNTILYDFEIDSIEWPNTDARYQKDFATTPAYIVDANGNKIDNPFSQVIKIKVINGQIKVGSIGSTSYFEIYRPSKESSNPYYFPNYFNKIGSPGTSNRYHLGSDQNQNPIAPVASPAIVYCNPGDTYLRMRWASDIYPALDDNYSDYYESNSYGLGVPGLFNPDAKQEELISGMRNSGSLLENTKVNKLNQFKSEDLEILKSKFGSINVMKEVGNVMKILQDRKETSIYISRTEMQNADNTSNVVKSTALLGTANKYDEDRGTIFPRSVVVHNRDMYYFDYYRGEVIRTSPNGQYPISEYGMRTYFRSKASQIASFGIVNTDVRGAYDEENKMYILTFIIGVNSETIGFYDPNIEGSKPRWISFYSFIPDHYSSLGTTLLSFSGVKGYRHNSNNVVRNNFYGTKYKQQINWYSNANPILKKVFKTIGLKSNKAWDVPLIIIEPDATYTRGMQSLLKPNHFELKEGEFSASYLNNMKTTSNTPSVLDLFNGDELRGYYLKHQMENLEDAEVWVLESQVGWDLSNKY